MDEDFANDFVNLLANQELCIERTFICKAPAYRDPQSVAQSTTEAVKSDMSVIVRNVQGNA